MNRTRRIALQFDTPELLEGIRAVAPEVEVIPLPPGAKLEPGTPVDAVMAIPGMSEQLARLLEISPQLQWIHILGTGIDDFPLELLRGRLVTSSKGATAIPIAEWVLAMMLAQVKQLPDSWITEPPANWYVANLNSLEGQTLGLVGFGEIGQAIARRALAFDMKVVATARRPRPSPMPGVELSGSVDEILPVADHLVLALPATSESKGLLSAQRMANMKPGSHLVNVSRAALLDQDALLQALDHGPLAAASLDVVEPEPLPKDHWLYRHSRVKLSPHISWSSPHSYPRMFQAFLDNLGKWMSGSSLQGVVDTDAGY